MAWGASHPLGRRPSWRLDLLGPPPPLDSLYIVGKGGPLTTRLWCLPLPLQHILLLHRAWRSPAGVLQLHHHHAVVLLLEPSSSTSPFPLLDQEGGDVFPTVRVLNAEVPSVRRSVIGDLDHDEYDSINPVHWNACARDLQGYVDASDHSLLDELIDGSW